MNEDLRLLDSMDRVDQAIQGAEDLDRMMQDVLDTVLAIFDCDRAWLVYPCDPQAATWQAPMERTRPEYPGVLPLGTDLPMDPAGAEVFRILRDSSGPVQFGPAPALPVPEEMSRGFAVRSFIAVALYPKWGKPWSFGLHQCSRARVWTPQEARLLQAVGHRLADALTNLLASRSLRDTVVALKAAQQMAHVGHWDLDLDADRISCSEETFRILGLPPEGLVLSRADFWARVPAEDRGILDRVVGAAPPADAHYDVEYHVVRPDGESRLVHSRGEVRRGTSGRVHRVFGTVQDITERRQAEETLRRLNRELHAVSLCNQTLLRAVDEQALLDEVCRIICDEAGYRLAWVGYADTDEAKTIRPVSWAGLDAGYVADARLSWAADRERGSGPAGIAIRTGETIHVQDFATDSRVVPWREGALRRGYRSGIALPLRDEAGRVFGVLLIYSVEPGSITPDEIRLMESLAGDLAFGIVALRTRAERMQAEAALQVSEQKYRAVADFTYDWETWIAPNASFVYVSPSCQRITGYSAEEFERDFGLYTRIVHPADRSTVEQHIRDVLRGGLADCRLDFRIVARDGQERWIEHICQPVYAPDGRWIGQRASNRDATSRMQAEHALRESEELYRKLVKASPDAITVTDLSGRIILVSPKALETFGLASEERAIGRSIFEWVAPADRERALANLRQLLATGLPLYHDFALLTEDGTPFDAEVHAAPIQSALGEPRGAVIITRDVTERKRAQATLRQLQLATEQSPTSIVITDVAGNIEYVNPKFTQVSGYAGEEVVGRNPRILQSGDMSRSEYVQMWGTILSGAEWRGEFHNRKKDGSLYWEAASISSIKDAEGRITHFVAVKEDITERKRAEAELRRTEARRHQLELELIQSQKLESLGTLASGLAHDFNNILSIIVGHLTLLRAQASASDTAVQSLDRIERAAVRGTALIKQLLTFARKGETVFESLPVNAAVEDLLRLLHETFPKTIILSAELGDGMPPVTADATQIHQVLLNLCVNSRDAMPDGGRLVVATTCVDHDAVIDEFPRATARRYVLVRVADSGIGMDDPTKRRIFEPFFTTKGPGQGTGLGLALVHSIVENHHGMIAVDSAPGAGTVFRLYLPAEERDAEACAPAGAGLAEAPGGSETVLVIEDEGMLCEMLHEVLHAKGYRVLIASDGEQGVETYSRHRSEIAVVLSDLGLPRCSGEEVVRRIKAIDPGARVVLASGFVDPGTRERLLEAGVEQVMLKPYMPSDVLRVIRAAIERGHVGTP